MTQKSPQIIEHARSLPKILLIRDVILTALCWLLYLYFLRDAFKFFGDVGSYIMSGFQGYDDYPSFVIIDTLLLYIEIIALSNFVFFLWAFYNRLRYGNKKRRRNAPVVTTEEIGQSFRVNPRDVEAWQNSQTLVVHHDKNGRITEVVRV